MKQNLVLVSIDGEVVAITSGKEINLGKIGKDCRIVDLRKKGEFKKETVKYLMEQGMNQSEAARNLGVSRQVVSVWLK